MKALISNENIVTELHPTGFKVHPDFTWVDLEEGAQVEVGYTYDDGEFYAPEPEPETPEQIAAKKRKAYQTISDPYLFKWQRGEATKEQWLEKVAEVDNMFN